jgi:hypothetical protein
MNCKNIILIWFCLFTIALQCNASENAATGTLTVQAHDKDGWITHGGITIYSFDGKYVAGSKIEKASHAQNRTFKLKPGQYRVKVSRKNSNLELTNSKDVIVSDNSTETCKIYFESGTLTVQAYDKDGWITHGSINIYRAENKETPDGVKTQWNFATSSKIEKASHAQNRTFKLKPGQYRVKVSRKNSNLELTNSKDVIVSDNSTETCKIYFESGTLTVQAYDKDGWITHGSINVYRAENKETPDGVKTQWNFATSSKIEKASHAQNRTFKLKPEQYRVKVSRKNSNLELTKSYELELIDQGQTTVKSFFESGAIRISSKYDGEFISNGTITIYEEYKSNTPSGVKGEWRHYEGYKISRKSHAENTEVKVRPGNYRIVGRYSKDNNSMLCQGTFEVSDNQIVIAQLEFNRDTIDFSEEIIVPKFPRPQQDIKTDVSYSDSFGSDKEFTTLTDEIRAEYGLPIGVKGISLKSQFYSLPAGIVVESLFHRLVTDEKQFMNKWNKQKECGQILVGFWKKDSSGQWNRQYKMVTIPEDYKRHQRGKEFQQIIKNAETQDQTTFEKYRKIKQAYTVKLQDLIGNSKQMSPDTMLLSLKEVKSEFDEFTKSEDFQRAKQSVIEAYIKGAPIAQKILLKSIEKSRRDSREELLVNLAKATITGGGSVGTLIMENTISSGFEVLSEEGILTSNQVNVLRGTTTVLQTINGIDNTEDVISALDAVNNGYKGLVEIGVISEEKMDDKVKTYIRAGDEILELIVLTK